MKRIKVEDKIAELMSTLYRLLKAYDGNKLKFLRSQLTELISNKLFID